MIATSNLRPRATKQYSTTAGRRCPGALGGHRAWSAALALAMAVACGWLLGGFGARAADGPSQVVTVVTNLAYVSGGGATAYQIERSKLDLYLPEGKAGFATLVWFHGGALKEGRKDDSFSTRIGYRLASSGLAVAMANYRLSPMAKYPSYIDDAAAAFAWVKSNIAGRGGDPKRVFVGGHSAGAYLTFMLGLDRGYLARRGLDTSAIAGLIPVSGQTMTHYTVREERGLDKDTIFADAAAPIYHVRKDAPPLLLIFADQDLPARVEENRYLVAALKAVGHTNVIERMISGRDHGSVAGNIAQPGDPAAEAILRFVDATPIR